MVVKSTLIFFIRIITGMYLAQAQPDFRLTEKFLSLSSGSQKIYMVKIIFMPYSVLFESLRIT